MAHQFTRHKRVKVSVPVAQQRFFVQNLNKGDKVSFPFGTMAEPERLPDNLFQQYELMPITFKRLPFAFAAVDDKQESIQKILQYSLKLQKDEDVSYCCGFVCCVVKNCLNAIDVPCSLEMGYRKLEKDSCAHMWLNVGDIKVDNTYEKYLKKAQIVYLEKTTPNCYQKGTFSHPKKNRMPTDQDNFSPICYKHNIEIFIHEPDKGLALGMNQERLYIYFFTMVRFMWDCFGVQINGINPVVRHYCWGCGKFPASKKNFLLVVPEDYQEVDPSLPSSLSCFKYCNQCIVARYCSYKCQEDDWDRQHRFVCVSRVSTMTSD